MKIKYLSLFIASISLFTTSCQQNKVEVDGVASFQKEFKEHHPEGLSLQKGWYSFSILESVKNNNKNLFASNLLNIKGLIEPIDSSIYKSSVKQLKLSSWKENDEIESSELVFSENKAFKKSLVLNSDLTTKSNKSFYGNIQSLKLLTSLTDSYNKSDLKTGSNTDNYKSSFNATYYIEGETSGYYLESSETYSDNDISWNRKEIFYFDLNYEWQSQSYYYEKTAKDGSYSSLRILMAPSQSEQVTIPNQSNNDNPLDSIDLDFTEEKLA